ncbi:MAG TPA: M20/M25/M40 family metallo-hydrolase [Verrucomicrobiae bacterium]|nr:M20/M25/M40 family metallo-hydrolase [Verrucomicrobiae bacterium]
MKKLEQLLSHLIAIPSVNPALTKPSDPAAGEERIGQFVADFARKAGMDVESFPVEPRRFNIVARLQPSGPLRQRVILAPHLDTVGVGEGEEHLFRPRRQANRIYGRGACDTKGSVASMLMAATELARTGQRPASTEIVFLGLVDEEYQQAGSRAVAKGNLKADLAIVGEPTGLKVVTAHKGVLWLRLKTHGKAAHGARPELGRNAVHAMAKVVDRLETEYAASLRLRRHPVLGRPTINVGAIQGGRQPNIVPDECWISIDRRTLPGENDRKVTAEIKEFLAEAGLRVTVERAQDGVCAAMSTEPSLPLVEQLLKVARQKQPAGVDYFSDASVLAGGGIPSVLLGPGDIAQAHRPDEWIDLGQLERAFALLTCFLKSLP